MDNAQILEKMYKGRFSNPIKHRFFEFLYGHKFNNNGIIGFLRTSEGGMLYRWASTLPQNSVILEIGVLNGLSTCYLGAGAKKSNSKVYSIDPFSSELDRQIEEHDNSSYKVQKKKSKEEVNNMLSEKGLDDNVKLIEGFSIDVSKTWDREIDFLWIDGNHNQTRQDYEAWRKFLKNGSRVAFHDSHPKYGRQEIADYVESVLKKEKIKDLEQVKSTISFIMHNN